MGLPEGKERGKGTEEIFETMMTENSPKLMSDRVPRTHEAQRTPNRINAKKITPRHIVFKYRKSKVKEERSQRGKNTLSIDEQRKDLHHLNLNHYMV